MAKKHHYTTEQSYQELVYGRYIFAIKITLIIISIIFAAYLILNGIARSLKEEKKFLSIEQFLSMDDKARAQYRVDVRNFLIDDVIKYRTDTVYIAVDDSQYLFIDDKGAYDLPDERAVYDCRLFCLELSLKRSLVELMYPFVYTMVIHQNAVKDLDLARYTRHDAVFPLYISNRISPKYSIKSKLENGNEIIREVAIRDSMADFFSGLYKERFAQNLFDKYVGSGTSGVFKYLSIKDFIALSDDEKKEQRRAFLSLTPTERLKARSVKVFTQTLFGVAPLDEKPGKHYSFMLEKKLHEGDIFTVLLPVFNMATFSLLYPTAMVTNVPFGLDPTTDNFQALLFIALKSGLAPAQYQLMRKDCPKVLKNGMYADITDYIVNWDQFKYFPKFVMSETSLNNKQFFGIPDRVINTDAVIYRRDWLEEPAIKPWFEKKGWIHPKDKRPYIPFNWNYDDFHTIANLIKKSDPAGKRKGFVDMPSDFLYLFSNSLFHNAFEHFLKPNPTRQTTWLFFEDNPVFKTALTTINTMYWKEKCIRSGVEISYQTAQSDFVGGRSGMCNTTCRGVLRNALMEKYSYFGKEKSYGYVVGLAPYPGSSAYPNLTPGDCNIVGFNPYINADQLQVAVEWMKESYYGECFNNDLFFKVKESRTLGSESTVFRDALASPYQLDTTKIRVNFYDIFPAHYVEFFNYVKDAQAIPAPPKAGNFGLTEPLYRQLQDEVFQRMFQKIFMDSLPDYDRIIKETANYCNTVILNFKDNDMPKKFDAYYSAMLGYYNEYVPEYYPIFKERYEKFYKYW